MKDQHFVVTGGATGIGADVCSQLRALGAHLTVLDLLDPGISQDTYVGFDLNDITSIDSAAPAIKEPCTVCAMSLVCRRAPGGVRRFCK